MPSRVRPFEVAESAIIVLALVLALVRVPAEAVERWYSNGAYPAIDRAIRSVSGRVPFCVGDALFALAIAGSIAAWASALAPAHRRRKRMLRAAFGTLAGLAAIFVWFEIGWALNYSRVPLAAKVALHAARPSPATVDAFANRVVDELSRDAGAAHAEHAAAPADGAFVAQLEASFEATIRRLGDAERFAPPRVKPTVFQPFFAMSGTSGFTDPWTHEINLDAGAFFFERPAYYAHEWAHVAGFTDESEANFIAAVACTRSRDPLLAYSGWLLVWFNLPQDVHVTHRISRLAYADLIAVRTRYFRRINRRVASASRTAYDRYLKSNHVAAGYASYGLFIGWMTGARFDPSGLPIVHSATPAPAARRANRVRMRHARRTR